MKNNSLKIANWDIAIFLSLSAFHSHHPIDSFYVHWHASCFAFFIVDGRKLSTTIEIPAESDGCQWAVIHWTKRKTRERYRSNLWHIFNFISMLCGVPSKNMHKLTMKWKSNWHLMFDAVYCCSQPHTHNRWNRIFQVFNFMTISCLCIYTLNFKIQLFCLAARTVSIMNQLTRTNCFE